jgi:maleylacetoacetate isomerase
MKLYGYFRSSASFRLRIALALKNISHENAYIHLTRNGGEQLAAEFRKLNPQALVPILDDDGKLLIQSMAIIEYLDETHPQPPLLPKTPAERARVRALAQVIACEIHPLNNLRVLKYLGTELKQPEEARNQWYHHWVALGLEAVEGLLAGHPQTGRFCHGDAPSLVDICLVPQIFNAQRLKCPLEPYPTVMRVFAECMKLPAFDAAQPMKQADAE